MTTGEIPRECAACHGSDFSELDTREEIVRLAEMRGRPIEIVENSSTLEAVGGIGCFLRYRDTDRYYGPTA
jgi:peptide subunit release factor 1 (eRF1)